LTATLKTPSGDVDIHSSLIGDFNIYNILAAAAASLCLKIDLQYVAQGIDRLERIPGRLELVPNKRSLAAVVDYAHTPDALLKALQAVRPLAEGKLITVFGCGGDRDKGKRGEMGAVAAEYSDLVWLTSDNPRTEDPAVIAAQVEAGILEQGVNKLEVGTTVSVSVPGYFVDLDRESAIRSAVQTAGKDDLVFIAGKGHEDYQIIGTERRAFDDREVVVRAASEEI
jgi:UDP-N-acetylmuramoyl-L-alanyl-D-glutamate--2,6-diaminopimelate ligase